MMTIDILMITYNRAAYTRLSLARLLDTCDESMRVWVWHNGTDRETLDVVESMRNHPRFHRFHHSPENKKLREPTNWFWQNAEGAYLSKVDDDCLMPAGWGQTLRDAHESNPDFGVIGCWRFPEEDFVPELANKKIQTFAGGHQIMRNCWVEGSGYLMKRACIDQHGLIREKESFTRYCIRLAAAGWIHGWYYPFLYQEHMDDPRSPHTMLKSDADIERWLPLSAMNNGVTSVEEWKAQLTRSAKLLQEASSNPRHYVGIRRYLQRGGQKLRHLLGSKRQW